jgi:hypothetical protein
MGFTQCTGCIAMMGTSRRRAYFVRSRNENPELSFGLAKIKMSVSILGQE